MAASLLRGPAAEELRQALSPAAVRSAGLFSPEAAAGLLAKVDRAGRTGASVSERDAMALMGLFTTQLLHARFVVSPPAAAGSTSSLARTYAA